MSSKIIVIGEPLQTEIGGKRFYRVELVDEHGNHFFKYLRSVTTICKGARLPSFLDTWQNEQIEALGVKGFYEALDSKAHDGTVMHKFIEDHVNGKEVNRRSLVTLDDGKQYAFDDDTWPMFEGYLAWEEKRKPESIWQEKTVYSLKHGYAGRADRLAIIDGLRTVIDYKSAKRPQDDHKQQGSAYLMAINEMGEDCEQILILCLGNDEKRKQPYTESIIKNPHDIHNYFMSFYLKNQLVNWCSPVFI